MAVRLQLENGKIKDYRTYWTSYSTEPGIKSTHHTKCGLYFEETPKTGTCGHLDCAIYAAKKEAINPLVLFIIFLCLIIVAGWFEKKDLFESINNSMSFFVIGGIMFISISIWDFKTWLELTEFKNHETIHGVRAYRVWA